MIYVNIKKAKDIKKNQIRAEREKLFEQLDIEFMKALEMGDTEKLEQISIKKQKLRDATDHILLSNAKTVDELKTIKLENIIK